MTKYISPLIITVLAAFGILVGIAGCVTAPGTTQPTLDPAAGVAIRATLSVAVPLVEARDKNAAPYFQAASSVFRLAAQSGQFDPTKLQATLGAISINELHDATAQQVIMTAVAAYRAIFADIVNQKIDATTYGPFVQSVLLAAADGIDAGLGATGTLQIVEPAKE